MNTYIRVAPDETILEVIQTELTLDTLGRNSAAANTKPVLLKVTSTFVPEFDPATQRLGPIIYTLKSKVATATYPVVNLTEEEIETLERDRTRSRVLMDEPMAAWRLVEELYAVVIGAASDISEEGKQRIAERQLAREKGYL